MIFEDKGDFLLTETDNDFVCVGKKWHDEMIKASARFILVTELGWETAQYSLGYK